MAVKKREKDAFSLKKTKTGLSKWVYGGRSKFRRDKKRRSYLHSVNERDKNNKNQI